MMLCPFRPRNAPIKPPETQHAALIKRLLAEYQLQRLQGTNVERYYVSSYYHSWLESTYGIDMGIVGGTLGIWEASTMKVSATDPSVPIGVSYVPPEDLFGSAAVLFKRDNSEAVAAHFSDVNQGALGNCWLMAAIAAVARYGVAKQCITSSSVSEVCGRGSEGAF